MDISDIEKRLQELEELKSKVQDLLSLSQLGQDVRQELEEVKILKSKGVDIPHLDKQFADQLYPKRQGLPDKNKKPLLESEVREALDRAPSAKKAARLLGVSYPTFKKYTKLYGIHQTKGWPPKKGQGARGPIDPKKGRFPIHDILDGKHPDFPIHRLKDKLIRSGTKKAECEQCGYGERRITDGKIPLLLNFEDGDKTNHKIENLKILCYNCTFCSGRGYIRRGTIHFSMDPDVIQGAKKPIRARF